MPFSCSNGCPFHTHFLKVAVVKREMPKPAKNNFKRNGGRTIVDVDIVAKKPGSKKKNGEVMDEDCIWSQSPATRHSAASTKAHCKQLMDLSALWKSFLTSLFLEAGEHVAICNSSRAKVSALLYLVYFKVDACRHTPNPSLNECLLLHFYGIPCKYMKSYLLH